MNIATMAISIGITFVLMGSGCSDEEPLHKPSIRKPIVKKAIQRPEPQPLKPAPVVQEAKPEPVQERIATKTTAPAGTDKMVKPEKALISQQAGVYLVKDGDTLSKIAERKDVYGDPLKWPILYRSNRSVLGILDPGDDLAERALTAGTRLKIITPEQAKENLKRIPQDVWVVNALSVTSEEEMAPSAIMLLKNKYPVYVTHIHVKGIDYLRLRVGFFEDRQSAGTEGKKIARILKVNNVWTDKVEKKELEEYGGFIPEIENR
jgi:hypothetical protein